MKGKIYTVDEARRTLPLVQRIVGDVRGHELERAAHAERYRELYGKHEPTAAEIAEMQGLEQRITELRIGLSHFAEELESLGCFLRNSRHGEVVWYAEFEGRVVYLSWNPAEPTIEYYHELESNNASRTLLANAQLPAPSEP